jgi:uncharacterized protein YdhG (YjbR/CyaY superfamily)
MSTPKDTKSKSTTAKSQTSNAWTDEEKAAMKARAAEMKAEARASKNKAEGESAALKAINAMKEPDRSMAKRIHAIIQDSAPTLLAKTWYGMPAYANKDGKVICFFQSGEKFKTRYATFGFQQDANLDDGAMWATSFALIKLAAAEEARISALVKKAVS